MNSRQIDVDLLRDKWKYYCELQKELVSATYDNIFIDNNAEFVISYDINTIKNIESKLKDLEKDIADLRNKINKESTKEILLSKL